MKKANFLISFIYFCFCVPICFAQQDPFAAQREAQRQQRAREELQQRQFERLKNIAEKNESGMSPILAKRESLPMKAKLNKEQKKRLAPNEEDLARYAAFLRQPKTGLIKLLPDFGCEENANIVRADADCLNAIPNSAFYSFREKEHTNEFLLDIRYKNGFFISDGALSQGILVSLGDIPLENISLESSGMKFLTQYKPESQSEEALKQFMKIVKGVKFEKYEYKKALRVFENMTYAIRVVAYQGKIYRVFRGRRINVLDGDKREDIILAFRVIRTEKDGSISLLWKELDRKNSPKVIFPKKENGKDTKSKNYQGLK